MNKFLFFGQTDIFAQSIVFSNLEEKNNFSKKKISEIIFICETKKKEDRMFLHSNQKFRFCLFQFKQGFK